MEGLPIPLSLTTTHTLNSVVTQTEELVKHVKLQSDDKSKGPPFIGAVQLLVLAASYDLRMLM